MLALRFYSFDQGKDLNHAEHFQIDGLQLRWLAPASFADRNDTSHRPDIVRPIERLFRSDPRGNRRSALDG